MPRGAAVRPGTPKRTSWGPLRRGGPSQDRSGASKFARRIRIAEGREFEPYLGRAGVVAWLLGLFFVLVLIRMAGDQDRAARHEPKRIDPYSGVTITRSGIA